MSQFNDQKFKVQKSNDQKSRDQNSKVQKSEAKKSSAKKSETEKSETKKSETEKSGTEKSGTEKSETEKSETEKSEVEYIGVRGVPNVVRKLLRKLFGNKMHFYHSNSTSEDELREAIFLCETTTQTSEEFLNVLGKLFSAHVCTCILYISLQFFGERTVWHLDLFVAI